jgi:hypothetical protein
MGTSAEKKLSRKCCEKEDFPEETPTSFSSPFLLLLPDPELEPAGGRLASARLVDGEHSL